MKTPSIEPGEIYFIGERDMRSGERSPYVKIGLVGPTRTSHDRLYDHRTSSPRELIVHGVVRTDLVAWAENALHKKFAKHRIRGEWFVLDDEIVQAAIRDAQELAMTLGPLVKVISTADTLRRQESDGTTIEATGEVLRWLADLSSAKVRLTACSQLDAEYTRLVRGLAEAGAIGPDVGEVKSRDKVEFDEKAFKQAYPDLWADYLIVKDKGVSGKFTVATTTESPLEHVDPALAAFATAFWRECSVADERGLITDSLKGSFLELEWHEKSASLDVVTAESHLKSACGTAEAIRDVCKWKRGKRTSDVFDEERFKADERGLFEQFCVNKSVKYVDINRTGLESVDMSKTLEE
jgi:hypothetical protein